MSFRCDDCHEAVTFEMGHDAHNCATVLTAKPVRLVTKLRRRNADGALEIAEERNLCRPCASMRAMAETPVLTAEPHRPAPGRTFASIASEFLNLCRSEFGSDRRWM